MNKDSSKNERFNNTSDQYAAQPAKSIGDLKYFVRQYNLTKALALHGEHCSKQRFIISWGRAYDTRSGSPGGRLSIRRASGSIQRWHAPAHPGPGQPLRLVKGGQIIPRRSSSCSGSDNGSRPVSNHQASVHSCLGEDYWHALAGSQWW